MKRKLAWVVVVFLIAAYVAFLSFIGYEHDGSKGCLIILGGFLGILALACVFAWAVNTISKSK